METNHLKSQNLPSYSIFAGNPPKNLYHYTTINGAYGIISSKSLWMTKIKFLNDESELSFCIKFFQHRLNLFIKKLADKDKIDFLSQSSERLNSFENINICIASFCEDSNLLSQWRSYGSGNEGIAIGFSSELLKECCTKYSINLWKCIYIQEIQAKIMDEIIEALSREYDANSRTGDKKRLEYLMYEFSALFLQIAPIIKNYYFREEHEWRLVTLPISVNDTNYGVKLVSNKRLIPVYEFKFEPECIKNIVIGPSERKILTGECIGDLLIKNNYKDWSITYSDTPYRKLE